MTRDPENVLLSPAVITAVIVVYIGLLLLLLFAELGVPGLAWLRATNQVLILLALLFLPFLFLGASHVVRSISFKVSGQELHLELVDLDNRVHKEMRAVESRVAGQVSTAEQALWPMLAGDDPGAARRWRERHVVIGSKLDPSQAIFAHLLAVWLERRVPGLRCTARVPNGGSLKNFADLKHRWIDVYVDYTGTSCRYFNLDPRGVPPAEVIDRLNEYGARLGVRWLGRLGPSEGYLLVLRRETADAEGVRTINDLTRIANRLVFTADPEFLNRADGYVGLASAYDLEFRRVEPCRITSRYAMLDSGEADVFVGYETDAELQSPKLLALKDSDGFFPDYHALPVVNAGALEAIPDLQPALQSLEGVMTTAELAELVHRLHRRGQRPALVRDLAEQFLDHKGYAAARLAH